MDIPNPYEPEDPAIEQQIIAELREVKPDFYQDPDSIIDDVTEAKRTFTPAQKRQFIAQHRHKAERPLDEWSRSYMGMLINLGAKDLDITHAVDEMLFYIDSGGDRRAIRRIVEADTNLMIYNIHPKNFDQINRFLKATSVHEPEILYEWQGTLIACGVKKKAFREHPEFQWVTDTAYATDPRFKKDIEKMSKSS